MSKYRNTLLSKEQITNHLQLAAKSYEKYADSILMFIFQKNVHSNCEIFKVRFGKENFMHLVGIKSKTLTASGFYRRCFDGTITFDDCAPSHDPSNRNARILLLPKMMNFSECRIYNIAEKNTSTIQNDFQIACGNQTGIIGFDYRGSLKCDNIAIPTTLLNRPLGDYCSEPKRILFVYKLSDCNTISTIYEIKEGLYDILIADGKLSDNKASPLG